MISSPIVVVGLMKHLRANEKQRAKLYMMYNDLIVGYRSNINALRINKYSVRILFDKDVASVILLDLVKLDKKALDALPDLKSIIIKDGNISFSNCIASLAEIAGKAGISLDADIQDIEMINNAVRLYKATDQIEKAENIRVRQVDNSLSEDDLASINTMASNNNNSVTPDDFEALSEDTLKSLASMGANYSKAEKTDFSDNIENEEVDLTDGEMSFVEPLVKSIVMRYEKLLRPMLELDSPYGVLYNKGLATIKYNKDTKSINWIAGEEKSSYKIIFDELNNLFGNKIHSGDLRNKPTAENMADANGPNYYPSMMLSFALGYANGKKHINWAKFEKAITEEIRKRIGLIAKAGLLPTLNAKVTQSFCNCMLVTHCGNHGSNLTIRVCIANTYLDAGRIQRMLKENSNLNYFNSDITVEKLDGFDDVVDIKIISDIAELLNTPYWAYQSLQKLMNNGTQMNAFDGFPIGRTFEGKVINLSLVPSEDFITMIAAGSGAGKGVLTLSLIGAALSAQMGVGYQDYKPDMAECFWDAENKFPGLHTFTLDGLSSKPRKDIRGREFRHADTIPVFAKEYQSYAGTLMYLKTLGLILAAAQWKTDNNDSDPILWIFDEIQAFQSNLASLGERLSSIKAPRKNEPESEIYNYAQRVMEFIDDVNNNLTTYINTTGRKSSLFTVWICQNTDAGTWKNFEVQTSKGKKPLLGLINKAGTMRKVLGKGNEIGQYALGGLKQNTEYKNQLKYVKENRFFCIVKGAQTSKDTEAVFFKPFLTLNTDDIYDPCWTKGMGRTYGYKPKNQNESDEQYRNRVLNKYESNCRQILPGDNKYGVNAGTGFVGLVGTYCNQNETEIKRRLQYGYEFISKLFNTLGLSSKYGSVEEYLYDFSDFGFIKVGELLNFNEYMQMNGGSNTSDDGSEQYQEIDSGLEEFEDTQYVSGGSNSSSNNNSFDFEGYEENNLGNERFNSEPSEFDRNFQDRFSDFLNDTEVISDEPISFLENDIENSENMRDLEDLYNGSSTNQAQTNDINRRLEELNRLSEDTLSDEGLSEEEIIRQQAEQFRNARELIKVLLGQNSNQSSFKVDNLGNVQADLDGADNRTYESANFRNAFKSDFSFSRPTLTRKVAELRGQDYADKRDFKEFLLGIKSNGINLSKVRTLAIKSDTIQIDNRNLITNGLFGETKKLIDIIDFKYLFKKCKHIQYLILSREMMCEMIRVNQLGRNAIVKVFEIEPDLINISFNNPYTGKNVTINRDSIENSQETVNKLNEEADVRNVINSQSLLRHDNIRSDKKLKSKAVKLAASTKDMVSNSPTARKLGKYTAVGVGAYGLGLIIGMPIMLIAGGIYGSMRLAKRGQIQGQGLAD